MAHKEGFSRPKQAINQPSQIKNFVDKTAE
jgi:hypothetical protein